MSCRNSDIFKYADKAIAVSEIDTRDDTYRLSLRTDPDALVASIRAVGLINPPILRQQHDSKYQIVCGFRRVMACKALGWREIYARILKGSPSQVDTLKLAILDNRSHRELNVVEQARGIQKLLLHLSSRSRLKMLSSLIGFPQNQKVFNKINALSQLPEVIQAGVIDEIVSFEAAVDLSEFSHEDMLSFFELFKGLKLSQKKQIEIITLVQEIAIRENLKPGEVLQSKEVRAILDQPKLNRNEKGARGRAYLKRRRFPALAKTEERFSKELKALKLNEHIHMTPPAYFEGGPYTLRITFKSMKDFDERRKTLDAMAKNPAFKRLLEPFES
jgi:ParB family chromosome partitioning protein